MPELERNGKNDKAPVWQKMYTREHYADVVRMIGYSGLALAESQTKTQELLQKHGKEKLKAASDDLLQFNEQWVHLTTETRRLAWQLLGPPPDYRSVDMMAEIMASGERLKGPKPEEKQKAKKPRKKKTPAAVPDLPPTDPTPVSITIMQQYREAKERHPDMLLLFRMHDFVELYDQDAETVAKLLGLTMTTRDNTAMAGFPHHALERYLHKLLKAGHRVAICEEVKERLPRGPIRREVARVVTPGSMA